METSLVTYDHRELQKKSRAKNSKNEYARGGPKWPTTQIYDPY
jgi:hypothetical protein